MAIRIKLVVISGRNTLEETSCQIGGGSFPNHASLVSWVIWKANKYFGRNKWSPKKDKNIAGFVAIGKSSGNVLTVEVRKDE